MNAEAEEAAPPAPEPKNASTEQAADGPAEVRARATSKREPSRGGVIEWLWGGSAMKAARRGGVAPNEAELEAQRQANLCVELARNALEPLQPLEFGPAYAPACELYREAIYWGLRAAGGVAKMEPAPPFEQLWDASERAALRDRT